MPPIFYWRFLLVPFGRNAYVWDVTVGERRYYYGYYIFGLRVCVWQRSGRMLNE